MPHGSLSKRQRAVLATVVRERVVHDLGAGDLGLAHVLLGLGAKRVIAVDKELSTGLGRPCIRLMRAYFADYLKKAPASLDVAFVAWPDNHHLPGLLVLLSRARTVVYLGKNTDGTACGWPDLFRWTLRRTLRAHVPARANSLIVVERPVLSPPREPTGEEIAGLHQHLPALPFEVAETLAGLGQVERERFLAQLANVASWADRG